MNFIFLICINVSNYSVSAENIYFPVLPTQNIPFATGDTVVQNPDIEKDTLPYKNSGISYTLENDSLYENEEYFYTDSSWKDMNEYYSVWDPNKINPYKVDATKFMDTVDIVLYDTTATIKKMTIQNFQQITYTATDTNTSYSSDTIYENNAHLYCIPVKNNGTTSPFGSRVYRYHYGIDLKLHIGDPVFAAFDGIVRMINNDRYGYGNFVVIRHYNGLESLYGHLSFSTLAIGKEVKAGQMIGYGGNTGRSTGPHLHFELRFQGNPINPEYIFDFTNDSIRSQKFRITSEHFRYLKEFRAAKYHTIGKGNTLSQLSKKYKVPLVTLCRLNKISLKTTLKIGRKLRVR